LNDCLIIFFVLRKISNYYLMIISISNNKLFLGLRGAISYALSLHLEFSNETRHVIITTTLCIILVTTLLFGGSTMPLMKVNFLDLKNQTNT